MRRLNGLLAQVRPDVARDGGQLRAFTRGTTYRVVIPYFLHSSCTVCVCRRICTFRVYIATWCIYRHAAGLGGSTIIGQRVECEEGGMGTVQLRAGWEKVGTKESVATGPGVAAGRKKHHGSTTPCHTTTQNGYIPTRRLWAPDPDALPHVRPERNPCGASIRLGSAVSSHRPTSGRDAEKHTSPRIDRSVSKHFISTRVFGDR